MKVNFVQEAIRLCDCPMCGVTAGTVCRTGGLKNYPFTHRERMEQLVKHQDYTGPKGITGGELLTATRKRLELEQRQRNAVRA
jgi:hypothetical protein